MKSERYEITKSELERLYLGEKLSSGRIAKRLGWPRHIVQARLRSFEIPQRSNSEAAQLRHPMPPEHYERLSAMFKGRVSPNKGNRWSEEQRAIARKRWQDSEYREHMVRVHSGERSPRWRGGRTEENKLLLSRGDWKRRRNSCYARDGWTCQDCGAKCLTVRDAKRLDQNGLRIQAHHIVRRRDGGSDELENLVTLCATCHMTRERASEYALFA